MAPVFQTLFVVVADINNKGLVIGECKKKSEHTLPRAVYGFANWVHLCLVSFAG